MNFNAQRLWNLCRSGVLILDAPDLSEFPKQVSDLKTQRLQYLYSTALLLFGTCAQESALRWERQRSPRWEGTVGGFSKWQLETASILATIANLKTDSERAKRATNLLFDDPKATMGWLDWPLSQILDCMRMNDNDAIGFLFAREHYRRVPKLIPVYQPIGGTDHIICLGTYWKQHYNTIAGSGTLQQYCKSWTIYCAEAVNG